MKYENNIRDLNKLDIDFIGFIFYDKSVRYIGDNPVKSDYRDIKKVGVFVNSSEELIANKINEFGLDFIQLHGEETQEFCLETKKYDVKIIKAFRIDDNFDFNKCKRYIDVVDLFLFDAKGEQPGGNGVSFNWAKLAEYHLEIPFLLSGGIAIKHSAKLKNYYHPQFLGIDVNSGFEISPGIKNIELLKRFINEIRS